MPRADKIKWKGFVQANLGTEDKKRLVELMKSADISGLMDDVFVIVTEGFAFSLKPPTEKTNSYAASFRGVDPDSPNAGWMLTGWGADPVQALVSLLYKHHELVQGDYSGGGVPDDDGFSGFG